LASTVIGMEWLSSTVHNAPGDVSVIFFLFLGGIIRLFGEIDFGRIGSCFLDVVSVGHAI